MRKLIAVMILLTGINTFDCYGQEKGIQTLSTKEEGHVLSNGSVKQLKDVLRQVQEIYKVNLLFETKLEGLTTNYAVSAEKDLDRVLRDLLTPLQLITVKLNEKNYVIKSAHASTSITKRFVVEAVTPERPSNANESEGTISYHPPVEVKGIVLDDNGKPLVGATILIKGTKVGGQTDADGNFTIVVPENVTEPVMMVSYVGMRFQEINLKNKTYLRVTLERFERMNEDVVIVGYGKQQKKDVVSSVSTIKAEEIVQENAINLGNAMQGKVNGAVIISRSGTPGNNRPYIMIRGNDPKYSPLIVIDGVPRYQDPGNTSQGFGALPLNGLTLDDINPDEVASISVLKDNAATAVYGPRGAGGVILIETKRGAIGKPRFSLTSSYSVDQPGRFPTLLDAYDYAVVANENARNSGQQPVYNDSIMNVIRYGLDPYKYANDDLYSQLVQRQATVLSNSLNISGGNEQVRYYLNGSYADQKGIIDAYNYKRYGVQSNLDFKLTNAIKLAVNTGFVNFTTNSAISAADGTFSALLLNSPLTPTYNRDGSLYSLSLNGNRLASLDPDLSGYQRSSGNNITVQANLAITPNFLKGLTLRLNNNINYNTASAIFLQKYYDAYAPDPSSPTGYRKTSGTSGFPAPGSNSMRQTQGTGLEYNTDYGFDYMTTIKKHSIGVTALGTHYYYTGSQASAYRDGIINGIEAINTGRSLNQQTGGAATESGRVGGVLRASYNYDGKYYLEYAMRADASDNFPKGGRWGFFPGGAVSWRLSREPFIRKNFRFIQDLKLRASIGITGIDRTSAYNYYYTYSVATTGNNGGGGYSFGSTYQPSFILSTANIPNKNLTWGQNLMRNLGIDFTLWDGLLSGAFDVYDKDLSRIQIDMSSTTPATFGIGSPMFNSGKERFHGYDGSLTNNLKLGKDMALNTTFNFTYTNSRVVDYGEASNMPYYQKKQGHSLGARAFYQALGIFQTQEEISKHPVIQDGNNNSTIKPGDIKYADLNGDSKIDINDKAVWYDNLNLAPYSFGLNMTYRYKAFSVNVFFQGAFGNWVQLVPGNFTKYGYENSWRPENPDALYPRIANSGQANNSPQQRPNTLYLREGDYIRFKNLRVSYNVPAKLVNKIGLSNVSVSAAALNLAVFSKIKDVDPEAANTDINNGGYYPVQRNYSFSLNIGF